MLLWQVGWIVGVAAACSVVWNARTGWSVLAGGAIGLVWTVYMALTFYRQSIAAGLSGGGAGFSPWGFLVAWLIKISLTISLLVIAFRSRVFSAPALLGGLSLALVSYWFRLAFVRVKHA